MRRRASDELTKNINLVFARKIKRLRQDNKLSQWGLSYYLGISRYTYTNLESGKSHFSLALAVKLCLYFKIKEIKIE